jgi:acyl carrier protein
MNDRDIRAMVQQELDVVAPGADLDGVPSDADLRQALDLDSLDFLNLVVRLDSRTGATTAETDYPKLVTLSGCAAFLGARMAGT